MKRIRACRLTGVCLALAVESSALGAQASSTASGGRGIRLSAAPEVVIGNRSGVDYELNRVVGAARLASGMVEVASICNLELKVYDAAGNFVTRWGRRGRGPGEFEAISAMFASGDSVFVLDLSQRRISLFAGSGFVSVQSTAGFGQTIWLRGRLRGDAWLVSDLPVTRMARPHGTFRDSLVVGVMSVPAATVRWFPPFPGLTHLARNPGNAPRAMSVGVYRFGPTAIIAAQGDRIWIGDTEATRIAQRDLNFRLIRWITLPTSPKPFDEARWDAAMRFEIARLSNPQNAPFIENRFDRAHRPQLAPTFSSIMPSADGLLWVEQFRYHDGEERDAWVFDDAGNQRATVRIPANFRLRQISRTHATGVSIDEDGVETVQVFRIQNASAR